MHKILIISTGGTFNKVYNPKNGKLEIDKSSLSLERLASKWLYCFTTINIIGKDSLEITDTDRSLLLETIVQSNYNHIIIIHGTDTIDITASFLANYKLDKSIILTGSMVPYSIDSIEASANLASAYGYLQAINKNGIYISMNGIIGDFKTITKDKQKGIFVFA